MRATPLTTAIAVAGAMQFMSCGKKSCAYFADQRMCTHATGTAAFIFRMIAYNLIRLPKIIEANQ